MISRYRTPKRRRDGQSLQQLLHGLAGPTGRRWYTLRTSKECQRTKVATKPRALMTYPAKQCLAKTMQPMAHESFTNVDQKAGRKSIACGASSEKLPPVPLGHSLPTLKETRDCQLCLRKELGHRAKRVVLELLPTRRRAEE